MCVCVVITGGSASRVRLVVTETEVLSTEVYVVVAAALYATFVSTRVLYVNLASCGYLVPISPFIIRVQSERTWLPTVTFSRFHPPVNPSFDTNEVGVYKCCFSDTMPSPVFSVLSIVFDADINLGHRLRI